MYQVASVVANAALAAVVAMATYYSAMATIAAAKKFSYRDRESDFKPRSGVRCINLHKSDAFYVEISVRIRGNFGDCKTATDVEQVNLVVRALAGAWERRGHLDVRLEVAPCSCIIGGTDSRIFMSIHMISDAPVSCTGTWVGNVIAHILEPDLCTKSLVNVDVQPVLMRAAVVQKHVLTCQAYHSFKTLGKAPANKCPPGTAALWRWYPRMSAMFINVVYVDDDADEDADEEAPVMVFGISSIRQLKKERKKKDEGKKDTNDPANRLELVLAATLSPPAVATVRRRIAERDGLVQGSSERAKVQVWLDHVARLPIPKKAEQDHRADHTVLFQDIDVSRDLENAAKKLDKVVRGLEEAKAAVLHIVGQALCAPRDAARHRSRSAASARRSRTGRCE